MDNKLISLVLPCYNEEAVIKTTLDVLAEKMKEYQFDNYEIVLVDDGSKDKTLELITSYAEKDSKIKVVSFASNKGQQVAFYAGMCYCSGEGVILMDADLQDPPECIPEMYRLWQEEGYHVVYGKRAQRQGESFLKKWTASLFYRTLNFLSYTSLPEDVGEFRLMDRVIVDIVINIEEKNRFNRALVAYLGFKQTELLFERPERFAGETKFGWKEMIGLAKDGLFSFSYAPITIIQFLGVFALFLSGVLLIYTIMSRFTGHYSEGWSSLMIVITFFGGAMLFALGIIGEYIARIHTEVVKRPLFITAKTVNLQNHKLPEYMAQFIGKNNQNLK